MRRYLLIPGLVFSIAGFNACDKKTPETPPAAVEPAAENKSPTDEAKPDEPKPDEAKAPEAKPDEAKAPEAKPDEAKPDEAKPAEPAAAPPAEFTVVPSPTLADIPAKPLHGKVIGKAFDKADVTIKYSSGEWGLEVSFADKQHFNVILTEDTTEPKVGYTLQKEKACCWGYLHHIPEGQSRATSLNAPNGFVVEITGWDVKAYDEASMMKQPAGTVKGRLAVVYDDQNWVAGTFETTFEYFGPPPHIAQAIKERQAAEALVAVGAWADLAAPANVAIEPNAEVWAAAREKDRWTFKRFKVASVDGKVVHLKGDATTAPGLIREVPVSTEVKAGQFSWAVDHLGPELAKVTSTTGERYGVRYLNPAGQPRDNELAPDRFLVRAATADAPGLPPIVFFDDAKGNRDDGLAIAKTADGMVAVLSTTAQTTDIVKIAEDKLTVVDGKQTLKKGQKVEAVVGCGMTSYMPREGKIVEVVEGGIAYKIDTEPCKGVTVRRGYVRPL